MVYHIIYSFFYSQNIEDLKGIRVGMFSYGSGLAATMFSLCFSEDVYKGSQLRYLHDNLQSVRSRLASRIKVSPENFTRILKLRDSTHHQGTLETKHFIIQNNALVKYYVTYLLYLDCYAIFLLF